jgi:hypothetical protein
MANSKKLWRMLFFLSIYSFTHYLKKRKKEKESGNGYPAVPLFGN